jgi:hypothetical protein
MTRIMILSLLCFLSLIAALPISGADANKDLLSGVEFIDGKSRSQKDFAEQTAIIIFFCGHCPSAASYMRSVGKNIHDTIENDKISARLIAITPDKNVEELKVWAKELGYSDALVGYDPLNRKNISTNNILQGSVHPPGKNRSFSPSTTKRYRLPKNIS